MNNYNKSGFLITPHPLTNFEIQIYIKTNLDLPKMKNGPYAINSDECESVIVFIGFYSFEVEYILKEINKFIVN